MSRTDKDRPYEVRVRDPYEPTTEYHWHDIRRWGQPDHDECDFERWLAQRDFSQGRRWDFICGRNLAYPARYASSHVPRWYTHRAWHRPERQRERLELRDTARSWNAGDDLDGFDFENRQHRRRCAWWWD